MHEVMALVHTSVHSQGTGQFGLRSKQVVRSENWSVRGLVKTSAVVKKLVTVTGQHKWYRELVRALVNT